MKALKTQDESEQPLRKFLEPIKMEKYVDSFIENGIESVDDLKLIEEKHLEKMSIPLGHRLKIIKKIKETFP